MVGEGDVTNSGYETFMKHSGIWGRVCLSYEQDWQVAGIVTCLATSL